MTTAGGLMFRLGGDGNFTARNAKTGDIVWQFQTGHRGGSGHPAAYELNGEQYLAISVGPVVWSFKLDGKVPPAAASSPPAGGGAGGGGFKDTDTIDTTSVTRDMGLLGGIRDFADPYTFNPSRAQAVVGTAVTFRNTGKQATTVVADDGSWTSGLIPVGARRQVRFEKPGLYTYVSKEFPWSYGQIRVTNDRIARNGAFSRAQATRGRALYAIHCASCHLDNLEGSNQAVSLTGPTFADHWHNRTLGDLYTKIRTTMPQKNPQSLSAAEYLDIMAYLLQANDSPPGPADLETSSPKFKTLIRNARLAQ